MYVENANTQEKISRRAEVIKGLPDWNAMFRDEVTGKYIKRVQEEAPTRGDMIVTGKSPTTLWEVMTNTHSLGIHWCTMGSAGYCTEARAGARILLSPS